MIWAQKGTFGMREEAGDFCSGAVADADTDTLHRCVSGNTGRGCGTHAFSRGPLHDAGSELAATDRGHTAAQIDVQARHERGARGMRGAHCCRHVEHVNT
ncbi:hypothetical protein GCM10017674_45990 [Streptomyces gardneri]|uniref:Uncharacterized protein n=1 Tax=Streptomyces gardneri TaxID=66892 RepID=A0A4Y3RMH8_9ACTN|nr:hypothetical protein SGA01_41290 [Streptomyces gardneri]GHH06108.1 hypothetical protein GCM10017674_45990 [Streptomyces gardneri]